MVGNEYFQDQPVQNREMEHSGTHGYNKILTCSTPKTALCLSLNPKGTKWNKQLVIISSRV
jgi:hypothetical protein